MTATRFTEAQVRRAVKGATDAGWPVGEVRVNLPGLTRTTTASGRIRWRVRVAGQPLCKINLGVGPSHPEFMARYEAARRGEEWTPPEERGPIPRSVSWLTREFENAMQERVAAGLMHPNTLKQRRAYYDRVRAVHGDKAMQIPRAKIVEIRDGMISTPGAADNMVKALRACFAWAIERGILTENPATGIGKLSRGHGAVPWSIDDLQQFRDRHPAGTMANLALTIFMFTACRLDDARRFGRRHERRIDGITYLDWMPGKRGSARVLIPILPPLAEAIKAQTLVGPTYLLNGLGRPFASSAAFGNWFRDAWPKPVLRAAARTVFGKPQASCWPWKAPANTTSWRSTATLRPRPARPIPAG